MQEEWKSLTKYNNYEISNTGKFRNRKTGRTLKTFLHENGYFYITIAPFGRQGKKVSLKIHRLVAEAFIDNPENKPFINHKDGIKTNNDISNLEWVTNQENVKHAYDTGLAVAKKGEDHESSVLTEELIEEIRKQYIPYDSVYGLRAIARRYKLKHNTLSQALNGVNWSHLKTKENSDAS
jgi:hypothetical protein